MKKKAKEQDQIMNTEKNRLFETMRPAKALAIRNQRRDRFRDLFPCQ